MVKGCGVVEKRRVPDLGYIQDDRDAAPGRPDLSPRAVTKVIARHQANSRYRSSVMHLEFG